MEPCAGAFVAEEENFRNERLEAADTGRQKMEIDGNRMILRRIVPVSFVARKGKATDGKVNKKFTHLTRTCHGLLAPLAPAKLIGAKGGRFAVENSVTNLQKRSSICRRIF